MRVQLRLSLLLLVCKHGLLVIGGGLALYEGDRAGRARRKAVAQPVAVVVAQELRLSVHHADRALMARGGAGPAAVAAFLVDMNDPSFHIFASRLCLRSAAASSFCFAAIFIICSYISSPTH